MVQMEPSEADGPAAFYDSLAATYDRLYPDWELASREQGDALQRLLAAAVRPGPLDVLDAAVGIGTQLLGLARHGHRLTGTDLSPAAVDRASSECAARGVVADLRVADMRRLPFPDDRFDALICADNAVAHLLTHADLVAALREFGRVVRPGGVLVISIRDYEQARADRLPGTMPQVSEDGIAFQVWQWHEDGSRYDLRHFQLMADGDGGWEVTCRRSTLWAMTRQELSAGVDDVGMSQASWLLPEQTGFFQPLLLAPVPGQHS
jgi:glycine/sarcosine N-methyltransferase